jgi:tripartite-type tricarboxylate transporter receptor subunit TctC
MIVGALKRVSYDVTKAFEPVVRMTSQPAVVVVPPSLPVDSIKELVAYARAKPGALVFGSADIWTNGHLGLLRFNGLADVQILHVPYKGSAPAMLDIIAGQIHIVFASTIAATPYLKSGRLKALAVTGLKRVESLPDLPTVDEAGVPGFKMTNSFDILAPAGTSPAILRRINETVGSAMRAPQMRKRRAADGSEPTDAHTHDQFKAEIAREFVEVARQVQRMDIKAN